MTVASTPLRASSSDSGRPTSIDRPTIDGATAGRLDAVALEQADHAERRAPDEARHAAHEPAHRALGEAVDVLLGRDQVDHGIGVETRRAAGAGRGCRGRRDRPTARRRPPRPGPASAVAGRSTWRGLHADLGRLALLAAHVALARRVVADEDGGQADRRRARPPRSAPRRAAEQSRHAARCRPSRSPSLADRVATWRGEAATGARRRSERWPRRASALVAFRARDHSSIPDRAARRRTPRRPHRRPRRCRLHAHRRRRAGRSAGSPSRSARWP